MITTLFKSLLLKMGLVILSCILRHIINRICSITLVDKDSIVIVIIHKKR